MSHPHPAPSRRAIVLETLRNANTAMSIKEVAADLGVHPNTVRFHLESLVESGRVERVEPNSTTPGRPPHLFRPVSGMDPDGPRRYRLLAELLVRALATDPNHEESAIEAGTEWGKEEAAGISRERGRDPEGLEASESWLIELLDAVGFDPQPQPDDSQLGLGHCPFLEIAEMRPEIVCPIHLGLMQGALEEWQSPLTVDRLDPFVTPDLCMAHMRATNV